MVESLNINLKRKNILTNFKFKGKVVNKMCLMLAHEEYYILHLKTVKCVFWQRLTKGRNELCV